MFICSICDAVYAFIPVIFLRRVFIGWYATLVSYENQSSFDQLFTDRREQYFRLASFITGWRICMAYSFP